MYTRLRALEIYENRDMFVNRFEICCESVEICFFSNMGTIYTVDAYQIERLRTVSEDFCQCWSVGCYDIVFWYCFFLFTGSKGNVFKCFYRFSIEECFFVLHRAIVYNTGCIQELIIFMPEVVSSPSNSTCHNKRHSYNEKYLIYEFLFWLKKVYPTPNYVIPDTSDDYIRHFI